MSHITIRHYRANGIFIENSSGNRILNNKIKNVINNGIEVSSSSANLFWRNEIYKCFDGIRMILGSTNNWVIENTAEECFDDGFESFLAPDINNAFIGNKSIRNRSNGFDIYGSNNLILDNLLIENGLGIVINEGSNSLAIGNIIRGTKQGTYFVFTGYNNHFSAENYIVCNRREGMYNASQFGILLDNEVLYNADSGIILDSTSRGNLVMDNKLICNIPENIDDRGTNNNLINNIDKPCQPCESPSDVCGYCVDEKDSVSDSSKEGDC